MISLTYSLADQNFRTTKSVGIFNLSVHLLQELGRRPGVSGLTVLSNSTLDTLHLPKHAKIQAFDSATAGRFKRALWDQWGVYTAARKAGNEWLFLPKGFASFLRACPVKLALYVHDTILESYYRTRPGMPRYELLYFRRCFLANLKSGRVIFTNSDFTKAEIERLAAKFGVRVPPLVTVGIGFDSPPSLTRDREDEVLVLASPFPHKRTDLALAYVKRWQEETGYNGKVRWVGNFPAGTPLPRFSGWSHAARLPAVEYSRAMSKTRVLVFFSEYEGFGMPPVEAVLHGACPVYSELQATREVMAGKGYPFRNDDYGSFARAMQNALHVSPTQIQVWRDELLQRFNWDRVCNKVVEAMKEYSQSVGSHRKVPLNLEPTTRPPEVFSYRSPKQRRFVQVFCRYLMRGGEENSVDRIAKHLEWAGHDVVRFWRASAEWRGRGRPPLLRQMTLAWKNKAVLDELRELTRRVQPDAWIFHNIIPVVSLGAYHLARELNVPIIHWVHNYRPLSPSGTLRANGKLLRPDDPWLAWREVWHGTWHGRLGTAGLALAYARLRQRGDFDSVKAWLAVSEEMRQIFLQAGYPQNRFFCLHHSWDIRPPIDLNLDEGYFLFLGRMVEEKGVRFLIELWRRPELKHLQLVMAGEGDLAGKYRDQTPPNIRWVGFVDGAEKRRLLAGCRALLFPCLWPEPFSTVIYESYEQGKPVLGSALGGLKELIVDRETGRLLEPGNAAAWTQAILEYAGDAALSREDGRRGLKWLHDQVSPAAWNRQFDDIIARVLE